MTGVIPSVTSSRSAGRSNRSGSRNRWSSTQRVSCGPGTARWSRRGSWGGRTWPGRGPSSRAISSRPTPWPTNTSSDFAEFDPDVLRQQLEELDEASFDLDAAGLALSEVDLEDLGAAFSDGDE